MRRVVPLAACALALWGCNNPQQGDGGASPLDVLAGFSGSPTMNPGSDCMTCHSAAPNVSCFPPCRASSEPWTVAGTVYGDPSAPADAGLAGVEVLVVDSSGQALTMVSNEAGNFYTAEALSLPLTSVMVQNGVHRMTMNVHPVPLQGDGLSIGSCNFCHNPEAAPSFRAPGRLFVLP